MSFCLFLGYLRKLRSNCLFFVPPCTFFVLFLFLWISFKIVIESDHFFHFEYSLIKMSKSGYLYGDTWSIYSVVLLWISFKNMKKLSNCFFLWIYFKIMVEFTNLWFNLCWNVVNILLSPPNDKFYGIYWIF